MLYSSNGKPSLWKRGFSLLLAVIMAVSMLPMQVFAEELNNSSETVPVETKVVETKPNESKEQGKDRAPKATEPKVTEPKVTEPKATEPKATTPKVTEPKVTEPKVTEPKVTEPKATEPKVTEPKVTEPRATEPKVTEPKVTEPKATEPKATEPKPTESQPVTETTAPVETTMPVETTTETLPVNPEDIVAVSVSWLPEKEAVEAGKAAKVRLHAAITEDAIASGIRTVQLSVLLSGEETALLRLDSLANTGLMLEQGEASGLLTAALTATSPVLDAELIFQAPETLEQPVRLDVRQNITLRYLDAEGGGLRSNADITARALTLRPLPAITLGEIAPVVVNWVVFSEDGAVPDFGAYISLEYSMDGRVWAAVTAEALADLHMSALPGVTCKVTEEEDFTRTVYSVADQVTVQLGDQTVQWRLQPQAAPGYKLYDPETAAQLEGAPEGWLQWPDIVNTLDLPAPDDIEFTGNTTFERTVVYLDDHAENRPSDEEILRRVTFTLTPDGEKLNLFDNYKELGLTTPPAIVHPVDEKGITQPNVYELSVELPETALILQRDDAGNPLKDEDGNYIQEPYTINYEMATPEAPGYAGHWNGDTYYYIQTREFVAYVQYNEGKTGILSGDENRIALSNNMPLFRDGELIPGSEYANFHVERIDVDKPESEGAGGNKYSFSVSGLPMFHEDGTRIVYSIRSLTGSDDLPLSNGDHAEFIFDNKLVPNFGSVEDRLMSGGTCIITLVGDAEYSAKKVWLDENTEEQIAARPGVSFTLRRYRKDGGSYHSTSPVTWTDGNNNTSFLQLNCDENGNIRVPEGVKLPKYDSEGFEYIYVVDEITSYDGGVKPDGADAYTTIYREVNVNEDGSFSWGSDRLPEGMDTRPADNTYIYNEGTICNKITRPETYTGVKTWKAANYNGSFQDVSVVLTLQRRHVGEDTWEDVIGDNGKPVTHVLDAFQGEFVSTDSTTITMDYYDEFGHAMEYQWVETAVYQGEYDPDAENLPDNRLNANGVTTLVQDGHNVHYVFHSEPDPEDPNTTNITNTIDDTVDYDLLKTWDDGMTKVPVTFTIAQVNPDNSSILYARVTLSPDAEPVLVPIVLDDAELTLVSDPENPHWHCKVEGLPKYNDEGARYSYRIQNESNESDEKFYPVFSQHYDEETGYSTHVHNGPGDMYRMTVEKVWMDDSDSGHRAPVKVGVYYREDYRDRNGVLHHADDPYRVQKGDTAIPLTFDLDDTTGWYHMQGMEAPPSVLYVKELTVGDAKVNNTNSATHPFSPGSYTGEHHKYEVIYEFVEKFDEDAKEDTSAGSKEHIFAITNRRVGALNIPITKTWQDGVNEADIRSRLQKAAADAGLTLSFSLSMTNENDYHALTKDGVQIGLAKGTDPVIETPEGFTTHIPVPFEATLNEDGTESWTVAFNNLPAYDLKGVRLYYEVEEVWLDNKTLEPVTDLSAYDAPAGEESVADLWADYASVLTSKDDNKSGSDLDTTNDEMIVQATNSRNGTKPVYWYKLWKDEFYASNGKRPDLLLNVYQVSYKEDGSVLTSTQIYRKFKWTIETPENQVISNTNWKIELPAQPKYDAEGREYFYYAVEDFFVHTPDFDYVTPEYYHSPVSNPAGTAAVNSDPEGYERVATQAKYDGADAKKDRVYRVSEGYYALESGGQFVNSIQHPITIVGEKQWKALPDKYDYADLPEITLYVRRRVKTPDNSQPWENHVAWMTLNEWTPKKASFKYELLYEGENLWTTGGGCQPREENQKQLPCYDDLGRIYEYQVNEFVIDGQQVVIGATHTDVQYIGGLVDPTKFLYEAVVDQGDHLLVNTYTPDTGSLRFQKHLQLPIKPDHYPAITFKLTRSYIGNNGEPVADEAFNSSLRYTKLWPSSEVKKAFDAAEKPKGATTVMLTKNDFQYDNLAIHAPNGTPYTYTITESIDQLGGYDVFAKKDGSLNGMTPDDVATPGASVTGLVPTLKADAEDVETGTVTYPVAAAFKNVNHNKDLVTVKATKVWDDKNDLLHLRPGEKELNITLWRSADAQSGQGNAINWQKVLDVTPTIEKSTDRNGNDIWLYTFKDLEKYADTGRPWKYKISETIPAEYTANPTNGEVVTYESDKDGIITINALTNKPTTVFATFSKRWIQSNGNSLTQNYLGLTMTVGFNLQVKPDTGDTWMDAAAFFAEHDASSFFPNKAGSTPEDFSRTISSAKFNDGIWTNTGRNRFSNLPRYIGLKTDDAADTYNNVKLDYRVVETSLQYGDSLTQVVTIGSEIGTTDYNRPKGDSIFQPVDLVGGQSTNKLPTASLTVTKHWKDYTGDPAYEDDPYFTRSQDSAQNHNWTIRFVVQRRFRGNDTTADSGWEYVPSIGTKVINQSTKDASVTIAELPRFGLDGDTPRAYQYRVRELKAGVTQYQSEDDLIPEGNTFNAAYTVTYDTVEVSSGTDTTDDIITAGIRNSMTEVQTIEAEKKFTNTPSLNLALKNKLRVTLVLQYLAKDNQWKDLATVTMDGVADADKNAAGKLKAYYEDSPYHAIWKQVPVIHPKGLDANQGTDTQYRVVERPVPTGFILESTDKPTPNNWVFTNTEVVKLTGTKKWENWPDGKVRALLGLYSYSTGIGWSNTPVRTTTVTATAANKNASATFSFENLPKYDANNNLITYKVFELNPATNEPYNGLNSYADCDSFIVFHTHGGSSSENSVGGTFTSAINNSHDLEIEVTKKWLDNSVASKRPTSDKVIITLYQRALPNGKEIVFDATNNQKADETNDQKPAAIWTFPKDDPNAWKVTFRNLPYRAPDNSLYEYRIEETILGQDENGDHYVCTPGPNWTLNNVLTGKTQVKVNKEWKPYNTAKMPDRIKVTLTNDSTNPVISEQVKYLTSPNYSVTFEDLPKYDNQGKRITYKVTEEATAASDGSGTYYPDAESKTGEEVTFINTLKKAINIPVTKTWLDGNDGDRKRPASIEVTLYAKDDIVTVDADGNSITNPLTITAAEDWRGTFTNLPKYDTEGKPIKYSLSEAKLDDYTSAVTGDETGFFVKNTIKKTSVKVTKTWVDNGNAYKTRPEDLTVILLRKTAEDTSWQELPQKYTWTKTGNEWVMVFKDLEMYNSDGKLYIYSVKEVSPAVTGRPDDSYVSIVTESAQPPYNVQLKNTLSGTVPISGDKTWLDEDDPQRPDSITVELYRKADGSDTEEKVATRTIDKDSNWHYDFGKQDKYDANGAEYTYWVKEIEVEGYESTVDSYDITNLRKAPTDIPVTKIWKDTNNHGDKRPDSITLTLLQVDNTSGDKTAVTVNWKGEAITNPVTLTSANVDPQNSNQWIYTFEDLAKLDDQGKTIRYEVKEEDTFSYGDRTVTHTYIPGYDEENPTVVTNTISEKTDISVTKDWLDNGNAYLTRPDTIDVQLWRKIAGGEPEQVDAEPKYSKPAGSNTWTLTFSDLDMYDPNGNLYIYSVTEKSNPDVADGALQTGEYEGTVDEKNSLHLINTLTGTVSISGDKTWLDNGNAYGTRPESITLRLMRKLEDQNDDEYQEYAFTVVTPEIVTDENRNETEQWHYEFTDLPKFDENGVLYIYKVVEDEITFSETHSSTQEYRPTVTETDEGFHVENLLWDKTSIDITKTWKDNHNAYSTRPESITVMLFRNEALDADGNLILENKVTKDADGNDFENPFTIRSTAVTEDNEDIWRVTIGNLPKYDENGVAITYRVLERDVDGNYRDSSVDLSVTNTLTGKVNIPVTKIWLDDGNSEGLRPRQITLNLYRTTDPEQLPGELCDTAVLSGVITAQRWLYVFLNQEKYDDEGVEYIYTVQEVMPNGAKYTQQPAQPGDPANTLRNLLTDLRDIPVTKLWDDNADAFGLRPDEITVHLYRKDQTTEVAQAVLTAPDWKYTFEKLPVYDEQGKRIEYFVTEDPVAGYLTRISGFTVTNTAFGNLTIEKKVSGTGGDLKYNFHFTLALIGTDVTGTISAKDINGTYGDLTFRDGVAEFTLHHKQSVTVTGLPAGLGYIVTEQEANRNGYLTISEGRIGLIHPGAEAKVLFKNTKNVHKLPQTGQLNWPIWFMGGSGLMMIAASLSLRGKKKKVRR